MRRAEKVVILSVAVQREESLFGYSLRIALAAEGGVEGAAGQAGRLWIM
jgi:hypothetical protein